VLVEPPELSSIRPNVESRNDMTHGLRPRDLAGAAALLAAAALMAGCSNTNKITGATGNTNGTHLVVFSSDRAGPVGQYDLYLYDLDAGGFRAITGINSASFPDRHPTISSDARFIAFQSNRGGSSGSDILLYDRAVPAMVALNGANTNADETEPAFTGDAQRLCFVQQVGAARRVRLFDGTSDTFIPLPGLDTTATYSDYSPAPDQAGSIIAFVSDRNGNPDVFVYDRTQKKIVDFPDLRSDSSDVDPTVTMDGRYVCFASTRAGGQGGYDLYLYDLQARAFVPGPAGLNTPQDERHPSIGGTAATVAFQSNRTASAGKNDLFFWLRGTNTINQATNTPSVGDDVEPSLLWP
jgi:Tol biopolymer transport system component